VIDEENMLATAANLGPQLLEAEAISEMFAPKSIKRPGTILVAGMGGSAISGDIASDLTSEMPITTLRGYSLPGFAGEKDLLLAVSYSGNTEEVLSCVKEAGKRRLPVIAVTSGGKLKDLAEERNYPIIDVKKGLQPRAALAYLCVPILKVLEKVGALRDLKGSINDVTATLKVLREEWGPERDERVHPLKQLAKKLNGKLPLIFASTNTTASAGLRLKCQFNENAKMSAHLLLFPELNHNEIVNLAQLKRGSHNFSGIILRDEDDHIRVKKRIDITKSLLGAGLGGFFEINSRGKTRLARLFSLIYFGDLLSVYCALAQGIDPTPVDIITRLKKEMSR